MKLLYRIIYSQEENWNVAGQFWLWNFDNSIGQNLFLCHCSDFVVYLCYSDNSWKQYKKTKRHGTYI